MLICGFHFSVLLEVYSTSFLPALSHAVTLLLSMAEHEVNRQLRVSAMHCLQAAAQLHRECIKPGSQALSKKNC